MHSEIILDGVAYTLVPKAGPGAASAPASPPVKNRMSDPTPWTTEEVAWAAGKSVKTIRKEVARKRLRATGKTKPFRFMPVEVARYLRGDAA